MIKIARKLYKQINHNPLIQKGLQLREEKALSKLDASIHETENLIKIDNNVLREIFDSETSKKAWQQHHEFIKALQLPDMTGGINKGDQKAIFFLLNYFQPKTLLEIGTHIGCSTVNIALTLKQNQNTRMTTVDIIDVNDIKEKRWLQFNSTKSPRELVNVIGFGENTTFVKDDSVNFLKNCKDRFDFIFLDGTHEAKIVYQEIPLAMKLLNKNGVILLHDYYPGNEKLWSSETSIPGPYLAVKKVMKEEQNINVLPLGNLPWETKLNSKKTSLALLTKWA